MRKLLVLCVCLLFLVLTIGCGDSGTGTQVSSFAYIHVTGGGVSGTYSHLRESGTARRGIQPSATYSYAIYTMNVDGTQQKLVTTTSNYVGGVHLSRDGKKIAYIGYDSNTDWDQVFILDVATAQSTRLTSSTTEKYEMMITPDNKTVVYRAYTGAYGAELWSVPAAGGTEKKLYATDTNCIHEPHISLDGKKVVFDYHDSGGTHMDAIGIVNIDGTGFQSVPNTQYVYTPALSADNKKVFYSYWESSYPSLYVVNTDGTGVKQLITTGASIDPLPVGDKLLFTWDTTGAYVDLDIYSANTDGTSPKKLTSGGLNFMQWYGD